jgi:tRNA-uridine 2-sulfurtransferase
MGVDRQKDQSYVLYMLGQEELRGCFFPWAVYTKSQVRHMALERGLPVADKDESMEICFVADDDYRRFLQEHAPHAIRPGPILDGPARRWAGTVGCPSTPWASAAAWASPQPRRSMSCGWTSNGMP